MCIKYASRYLFSASSNSLGNLTFMLPNGTYNIEITKKGYTSFSKKITVNGKSISEKAVINDSRCCISVKDQYDDSVNGAHISVNRADDTDSISDSYKTSQNGVCLVSLSEGEYEMNISKFQLKNGNTIRKSCQFIVSVQKKSCCKTKWLQQLLDRGNENTTGYPFRMLQRGCCSGLSC